MKIIICVDLNDGLMFNNRRQSRDEKVYENIFGYINNGKLWLNEYSSELFEKEKAKIIVNENFLLEADALDYCFIENIDISDIDIEELIIYRWDKVYPSDKKLTINYKEMKQKNKLEFVGKSHKKIIREVYIR